MTIEGRPFFANPDKTYEKQRQDRMQDAIDDYLQDDNVNPRQMYEEVLSCVNEVIDYHKKSLGRATALGNLMMGLRGVDPLDELIGLD